MLHTLECHHISHTQHASIIARPVTFILEVNYSASDKGRNTGDIQVNIRESILLDMKYTPFMPSTYFYLVS